MRIELIGGMGIGKTTLCRALHHNGMHCIYENLEHNPYLALSYDDPDSFGFYSQMTFVLGNFFGIVQNVDPDEIVVFDYSTITDKAYSSLFLQGKAQALALQTIEFLEEKEGYADLYINLTCSPETQLARVRARDRDHEAHVDLEFLATLSGHMQHYVAEAQRKGLSVLHIDTDHFDLHKQASLAASLAAKIRNLGALPIPGATVSGPYADKIRA